MGFGFLYGGGTSFGIAGTNYCGPGYANGTFGQRADPNGETKGRIDELCKAHDLAYDSAETSDNPAADRFNANKDLLNGINALAASGTMTSDERALAAAIVGAFVLYKDFYDLTEAFVQAFKDTFKSIVDGYIGAGKIILDIIIPSA